MAPALSVTRSRNPRRVRCNERTHLRIPPSVSYARVSNLIVYLRVRVSLHTSHAALVAERVRSLLVPPPRAARLRPARASAAALRGDGGGDHESDAPGEVQNLPRAFQKRDEAIKSTPPRWNPRRFRTPRSETMPRPRRCASALRQGTPAVSLRRAPILCTRAMVSRRVVQSSIAAGGGGRRII